VVRVVFHMSQRGRPRRHIGENQTGPLGRTRHKLAFDRIDVHVIDVRCEVVLIDSARLLAICANRHACGGPAPTLGVDDAEQDLAARFDEHEKARAAHEAEAFKPSASRTDLRNAALRDTLTGSLHR
jgi:hypothetical protein